MLKLKLTAFGFVVIAILLATSACNSQPSHPNQLNAFDGSSYDSLTLAHGALTSVRADVSTSEKQYVPEFNEAAAAYATAFNAYSLYRTNPNSQVAVSADIASLTASIVALESAFESKMNVSPHTALSIRRKAAKVRAAASAQLTISDILTELEIAAAIANTVPALAPYSELATLILDATEQAVAAQKSASGQPIDLSLIQPVQAI